MIAYLPLLKINNLHDEELRAAVNRVLDSGWYLKGDATRQFEAHYAEYIGTRYCVGCGNGLDALTLILRGYMELGVMEPGDEVLEAMGEGFKPDPESPDKIKRAVSAFAATCSQRSRFAGERFFGGPPKGPSLFL